MLLNQAVAHSSMYQAVSIFHVYLKPASVGCPMPPGKFIFEVSPIMPERCPRL